MKVTLPKALEEQVLELVERTGIPEEKVLDMISETAFVNMPPLAEIAAAWVRGGEASNLPQLKMPVGPGVPLSPTEAESVRAPVIPTGRPPAPSASIADELRRQGER